MNQRDQECVETLRTELGRLEADVRVYESHGQPFLASRARGKADAIRRALDWADEATKLRAEVHAQRKELARLSRLTEPPPDAHRGGTRGYVRGERQCVPAEEPELTVDELRAECERLAREVPQVDFAYGRGEPGWFVELNYVLDEPTLLRALLAALRVLAEG